MARGLHGDESLPAEMQARRVLPRLAVTACLVLGSLALIADRLRTLDVGEVLAAVAATPMTAILAAVLLGACSHLALSAYDLLAFARIGRKVPLGRALKGGFAGTVFAQVLGLGLVTGSIARLRVYAANRVSVAEAVALSGFVAAGFFGGILTLLACLFAIDPGLAAPVLGDQGLPVRLLAVALLLTIGGLCIAAHLRPGQLRIAGVRLRTPHAGWLGAATLLACADLVPAALSFWVLIPEGIEVEVVPLVATYVVAVALGHVIGSPGAVGPFEGVMLLALPMVPLEQLAAAVLVYRATYYGPPFLLAAGIVALARQGADSGRQSPATLRNRVDWAMDSADCAEAELALLGDKHIHFPESSDAFAMYGCSGRVWLMMGDPVGPRADWPDLIEHLERATARAGGCLAAYKVSARSAALWEGLGYRLQPLGADAVLDLGAFSLDGAERRELRRKVKAAQKAGVTFDLHPPGSLPADRLAPVAEAWTAAKKGREQTFSMGHWDPAFVARHVTIEAVQAGHPIAFVTLWVSGDGLEWTLDLMRQRSDVPNGTMHTLIVHAAEAAAEAGARRLNLCMAPLAGLDDLRPHTRLSKVLTMVYRRFDGLHGLNGLRRFKEIFRPDWEPRYLVARSDLGMVEALIAAGRLVNGAARHVEGEVRLSSPAAFDDADLSGAEPRRNDGIAA